MFLNGDDPTIPDKVIFHRCLAVVNAYVEKVQDLRPPPSQKEDTIANAEDDSQGSLSDADWYLVDMASVRVVLHPKYRNVMILTFLAFTGLCPPRRARQSS